MAVDGRETAGEERLFGMRAVHGRWVFVALGLLINICLGAVYAFSVFRGPLEAATEDGDWAISATASGMPFMVFLAMFALLMALAGGLAGRWGPKRTALLGGGLVGTGWILSGFSPNIVWLTIFYGVIAGGGVGIIYGCPIALAANSSTAFLKRARSMTCRGLDWNLYPQKTQSALQMLVVSMTRIRSVPHTSARKSLSRNREW